MMVFHVTHCRVLQCSQHVQHRHAAVQLPARHVVVEHLWTGALPTMRLEPRQQMVTRT